MSIDADQLLRQMDGFSKGVRIATKDHGVVAYQPWGTQRYLREQLIRGVAEGIHDFIVVKPRQVGASTELFCFDLFWNLKHKGMQGLVATDSDENKEFFRDNLGEITKTLPTAYSYPLRVANRAQMAWKNGSRLLFQTAGVRSGARLGRARGLSFVHATEVAFWGDDRGIKALRGALSERNPHACYVWESTANGFNFFYDLWKDAQRAVTQRAIFIPWWRHELYTLSADSKAYRVYARAPLSGEERTWAREIDQRWHVALTTGQWAWYRWKRAERMSGDQMTMHQEFPTLPEHAFQATGMGFLGDDSLARVRTATEGEGAPTGYRYSFGPVIEACNIEVADPVLADLVVWEEPRERPGTYYVIAADPAFGASATSDRSAATVWRAERDRMVQVAEFCSNQLGVRHFAWVLMHLCGAYQTSFFILELNGPGIAVWQEFLSMQSWGLGSQNLGKLTNVLGSVQHYLWKRPDIMGTSRSWQWKTNQTNKIWIMSRLRDGLTQGRVLVRSPELVSELGSVRQEGDRFAAHGRAHDDRVMTAALAFEQYQQAVLPVLLATPPSLDEPAREAPPMHEMMLARFFHQLNR